MDEGRQRLRDLSARLLRLHKVLLDRERREWEATRGPIAPGELLRLLLSAREFAWLRSLSAMIARIDEAVDADETETAREVEAFFAEARRLLRSGEIGPFEIKYREALQLSPEVVIAHAEVVKLLPRPSEPSTP